MTLRVVDLILATIGLILSFPIMLVIWLAGLWDTGAPLFFQTRVGQHQKPYKIIKFRTMKTDTESVATHLASPTSVTKLGSLLRRTKLDELPQLWNVLKGEMSLVGPRPCLPNQTELIEERAKLNVFKFRPGITGLAQICDIDMSTPSLLASTDAKMLSHLNLFTYFTYILKTIVGSGRGDRIRRKP